MMTEKNEDDLELYSSATEVISNKQQPAWPPAQPMYKRRETIPLAMTILLTTLTLLLIMGSLGLIVFYSTRQYRIILSTTATAQAQSTANAVTGTVQAKSTVQALATVQSNIEASATAQVFATATADAQLAKVTATVTALQNFFDKVTSGTPVLDDPLSDNATDPTLFNKWDVGTSSAVSGCLFTGVAYRVSVSQQAFLQPCFARNTHFSNFTYQVQMTILKGNQGGLLFRGNATTGEYYIFRIGTDGSYALDVYQGKTRVATLARGFNSAILAGLGQTNDIAVVANGRELYLFANQQYIASVTDPTLKAGQIGVVAFDFSTPAQVEFSNVQLWTL